MSSPTTHPSTCASPKCLRKKLAEHGWNPSYPCYGICLPLPTSTSIMKRNHGFNISSMELFWKTLYVREHERYGKSTQWQRSLHLLEDLRFYIMAVSGQLCVLGGQLGYLTPPKTQNWRELYNFGRLIILTECLAPSPTCVVVAAMVP